MTATHNSIQIFGVRALPARNERHSRSPTTGFAHLGEPTDCLRKAAAMRMSSGVCLVGILNGRLTASGQDDLCTLSS